MKPDFDVFDRFFGRSHNNSLLCTKLLDDDLYRRLHAQYATEISSKWGIGSIPTEKGFEEWLQHQTRHQKIGKELI